MTILKNVVEDLVNNRQLTSEEAVDRHFAPSFRQRTNGSWDDTATFRARIAGLREVVKHATITVLDEFAEGARYAERHVVDLVKFDGQRIVQEVYMFAERGPDGRFTRIEELTLSLDVKQIERTDVDDELGYIPEAILNRPPEVGRSHSCRSGGVSQPWRLQMWKT